MIDSRTDLDQNAIGYETTTHTRCDQPRFIEEGDSVIFQKVGGRHHISFVETYRGLSIPSARRKMKSLWAGHSLQNEMIHYLKTKNILKP
jgi:hypothetical protein